METNSPIPPLSPPPSEPLFSVVVAAHQTEPWLPQAIASVEAQTFRAFEAILYVEESTDDSLAIARAAAARASRFRAVPAPKSGSAAETRNYGIRHAAGRYIVFLDGDDWLAPDMLERLAGKLRETGDVEILAFAAVATTGGTVDWMAAPRLSHFGPADDAAGVFSGLDAMRSIRRRRARFLGYSWLNAFRTDFLRDGGFYQTPGLRLEDFEHIHRVLFAARKVAYLDVPLYAYRCRPGSATSEISPIVLFDAARQIRTLLDFARSRPVPADILSFWADQWLGFLHWMLFHPVTSRKYSLDDHARALAILAEDGGLRHFGWLSARASRPRRLAWPFFRLALAGHPGPARWFFRRIYYPLLALRDRGRQDRHRESCP